ncbi:MAG: topoisomerase DNA-binding C4 zinc finger domain-containing protein, partial [Geovibrio sp.]|nr:topoisomerase DNA-binding C4 zinc finger domain-containing protein [Geovibrio sp.]
ERSAMPHTFVIALIISLYCLKSMIKETRNDYNANKNKQLGAVQIDIDKKLSIMCPLCNTKMILRTARHGKYKGKSFWGCRNYPECHGIVNID